jgi:hypothetical protein
LGQRDGLAIAFNRNIAEDPNQLARRRFSAGYGAILRCEANIQRPFNAVSTLAATPGRHDAVIGLGNTRMKGLAVLIQRITNTRFPLIHTVLGHTILKQNRQDRTCAGYAALDRPMADTSLHLIAGRA